MNAGTRYLTFLMIAVAGFVMDIATKSWIFNYFKAFIATGTSTVPANYRPLSLYVFVPVDYQPLVVIPHMFNLRIAFNRGAVWSSFQGKTLLLTTFSILAIVFICYLAWKHRQTLSHQIFLGLIMAGAWGNLWDRLYYGGVRDFLDVYVSKYHWPTFNIADSCIVVGIGGYLVLEWLQERQQTGDANESHSSGQ